MIQLIGLRRACAVDVWEKEMRSADQGARLPTGPAEDLSPEELPWIRPSAFESFVKRPIRKFLYPPYTKLASRVIARRYASQAQFPVDLWLWGHRGNDYEAHRRRLNRFVRLGNARILVAGCGAGRDLASWLPYAPRLVIGVDYLNYERAWNRSVDHYRSRYPRSSVHFIQGNFQKLDMFEDDKFDVIGSDAVLEHVTDFPAVVSEFVRLLRPGGFLYATFGPLWHCWQGDHYSGWDELSSGYNHLVMDPSSYQQYLGPEKRKDHPELEEGRMWSTYGLFSYLRAIDYVQALSDAGLQPQFRGVVIEPRGARCLRQFKELRQRLLAVHDELDLLNAGMTVIYRKPLD